MRYIREEDSGTEDRGAARGCGEERGVLAYEEDKESQGTEGNGTMERVAGERGDTLISERIYKRPPRVPRIVRPSPTSYIYC